MTDSPEDDSTAPWPAVPSEVLYRALFEASHDGVCVAERGGRLVDVNDAMLQIFGETREGILELNVAQLFADSRDWPHLCDRSDREGRLEDLELRLRARDGRDIPGLVTIIGHRCDAGEVISYQVVICDVTRQRDADERLRHDALHDTLTQLPNRRFFFDRVQRLLHRLQFNPNLLFAVLFIDLDQFKMVNDSLGHRWGDELLVQVGERLVQLVRPEDIVARLGGDEFAVLLMDLPGAEEAVVAVTRIHEGIREPFVIENHPVNMSASLGMVLSEGSYESPEDVIRDADTAMYAAKAAGGRGWVQFDDTMRERVVLRLTMENALRAALDNEEFVVHFQPLVSMETGLIAGFEALLRWQHPDRGILLPGEFLSVAEETGLIVPIGNWVLREVCAVSARWREERADVPAMSVNVAPQQLTVPGLDSQIEQFLREFGLPGSSLRIEISERTFATHSATLKETLQKIESLGVELCLDEIGTKYSSLGNLSGLPFTTIKIDRGFVNQLSSEGGVGTVEAVLALIRQMGLVPEVEGVETEDQMADLRSVGCDTAQGHLFSGAVDVEKAFDLLKLGQILPRAAE